MKSLLFPCLPFLAAVQLVLTAPVTTNSPVFSARLPDSQHNCDCYLVAGPDSGRFNHLKFWDFRKVSLPQRKGTLSPLNGNNLFSAETIPLSQTEFMNDWRVQSWAQAQTPVSAIARINSDRNAFFARNPESESNGTQLVLRTTRHPEYSSTAEIDTRINNIHHCSLRVRLRIMHQDPVSHYPTHLSQAGANKNSTVPGGACAGIFVYRSATCESDVEILTSDPPHTIHYANQPDYDPVTDLTIPGASKTVTTLPTPWTEWVTHRMDWFADATRWYADNHLQASIAFSVPDEPSLIALNLWSDGGVWTGNMTLGESVYMGIEWIELAYNTSGPGGSQTGCRRPCSLDSLQHHH